MLHVALLKLLVTYNLYYIGSNILLEQLCSCPTVIQCNCSTIKFVAKLADYDFVGRAKQDNSWKKLLPYEPGGTVGMKAPEVWNLKIVI